MAKLLLSGRMGRIASPGRFAGVVGASRPSKVLTVLPVDQTMREMPSSIDEAKDLSKRNGGVGVGLLHDGGGTG
jgi:hypothetical protein